MRLVAKRGDLLAPKPRGLPSWANTNPNPNDARQRLKRDKTDPVFYTFQCLIPFENKFSFSNFLNMHFNQNLKVIVIINFTNSKIKPVIS